jgi:uncharacterized protein DUF2568
VKAVALALRFVVAELGAVGSFLWWGVAEGGAAIVVGLVAGAAVVALWAAFVAPRASRRLADPARFVLELVIFAAATVALAGAAGWLLAAVYAAVAVATAAAARVWPEPAAPH